MAITREGWAHTRESGRLGTFTENLDPYKDLTVLLVGPAGQDVVLMASYDLGGCCTSHVVSNATVTFDDSGIKAECPGHGTPFQTAYPYHPFNCGVLAPFPSPAPAPPYGSALAVFNGTGPDGAWNLFVADDWGKAGGSIADGWSLHVETEVPAPGPTPTPTASPTPTTPTTTATPAPAPSPTSVTTKKPPRAQLLAAAIRKCHKIKNNAKQRKCVAAARRRYAHRPPKRRAGKKAHAR